MRFLYFLKILFVSFEFLLILSMVFIIKYFDQHLDDFSENIIINDDLLKWTILLPISLFIWCSKEGYGLIFSNYNTGKILVNWPDYWKLKQHIVVSLMFSILFCLIAAYPWVTSYNIKTGVGLTSFLFGCLGGLVVAIHLYFAKMTINEILLAE